MRSGTLWLLSCCLVPWVLLHAQEEKAAYRGPSIDTHAHVRLGEDDTDATAPDHPRGIEALQRLDDAAGVTRSALIVMARKGQVPATRKQNDAVIELARNSQGRFFAVASVHPADGEAALAELSRVAKAGVKVIKLHPNTQGFDVADPAVAAVARRCGELGLIMLFDAYKPWDADQPGKLLLLSLRHPQAKFILAHLSGFQFRELLVFAALRKLNQGGNVWFDLSFIANFLADSPLEAEMVWTIRQLGMDRILFGSDWPVDTPAVAREAITKLGLSAEEQKMVLHDNARQLLGLP